MAPTWLVEQEVRMRLGGGSWFAAMNRKHAAETAPRNEADGVQFGVKWSSQFWPAWLLPSVAMDIERNAETSEESQGGVQMRGWLMSSLRTDPEN